MTGCKPWSITYAFGSMGLRRKRPERARNELDLAGALVRATHQPAVRQEIAGFGETLDAVDLVEQD